MLEISSARGAFAGKLLADMGADVVLVEPPDGDPSRGHAPFLGDEPGPERSLAFWHYNTSKRGVTLDLERAEARPLFTRLVARSDLLLESEPPGRLRDLSLDYRDLLAARPDLIHVAMTPFGRSGPRSGEQATDLTLLAGGGPAWMCGYDDHALPPVRGGGNQGYHTGCHFAVMSALVALLVRDETGRGQFVDVDMHAAANVTTEAGSYEWLVARGTVQRQTGRHAAAQPTLPTQMRCADGRYVSTGIPPRLPREFEAVHGWLESLSLREEFREAFLLELGAKREFIDIALLGSDPETQAIFGAGREALCLIASRLPAHEFFVGAQERGIAVGVVYAPEEAFEDPHFRARGFPVEVEHPELGRSFRYPGAPYRFQGTPWRIRSRAPLLGEHNAPVYGELGVSEPELAALRRAGVV